MTFKKCPRCELNYILDGGELCTVCRREVRGESFDDDTIEMCSECGENPALPGSEYCAACLKIVNRRNKVEIPASEDVGIGENVTMSIDNDDVSSMDELVIGEADAAPFDDDYAEEDEPSSMRRGKGRSQADEFEESGFSVVNAEDGMNEHDGLLDL